MNAISRERVVEFCMCMHLTSDQKPIDFGLIMSYN